MKKMYKLDSTLAGKQMVNTGLIDPTRAVRIEYQQAMHNSLYGTEVADAFNALQQDLTRVAKFKTNIEVNDLVYLFYFKLDVITDLLEMRRACRALNTRQVQKTDSSHRLNRFLRGQNPLLYRFTPENLNPIMSDFRNYWNEVYRKVNELLPTPRFEEYYRRAFFADSMFKDYDKFDRSPLVAFSRKYTCNFFNNRETNSITMSQSTAVSSDAYLPMEALAAIDEKVSDYLNTDGNYICGLLRKISAADGFTIDNGFWNEWKAGDTVPVNDASDVQEIIQNVWARFDLPASFTDEQVTSTFDADTGIVNVSMKTNIGQRSQILAGKFFKELQGKELCDAMQMNLLSTGSVIDASTGMIVTNYVLIDADNNPGDVYNMSELIMPDTELQYFHQKFIKLMPNVTVKFLSTDRTVEMEYIINQQGQWRFECDVVTMSTIISAFNKGILKIDLSNSYNPSDKKDKK